ncbi:MAG: FHA domain-containing protein, partial [Chloroflexota bacterium]
SKSDIAFTNEQTVSRVHATLAREGNTYRLYDEQSTSGTFLNGQRLPEYGALLNDGDEVQMGALVLRFRRET